MPKGPQRIFNNFFRPGRHAAKDARVDSNGISVYYETGDHTPSMMKGNCNYEINVAAPQVVTSVCSPNSVFEENTYISAVPRRHTLETIAEDDECSDQSLCRTGQTSSDLLYDSARETLGEHSTFHTQPAPCSSEIVGEIGDSEFLPDQQQSTQTDSTDSSGVSSPTSTSSNSQDEIKEAEDYPRLEDVVGFDARYQLLDEKVATERNMRVAVDVHLNKKVILMLYKSDVFHDHYEVLQSFQKCKQLPKMLKAVRFADGRCLLVLEYGNFTLSEWRRNRHEQSSRKAVLKEILEAFVSLHKQEIRSGKVKPSLLMWYSSDQSWKLLGPYLALGASSKGSLSHSHRYAAPELLHSEERSHSAFAKNPTADMWSIGVIAFEVLSGRRFHGATATLQAVGKYLIGRKPVPSSSRIREPEARSLLKKLLSLDPTERPTAKEALEGTYFKTI